jgi:hypothetical protein
MNVELEVMITITNTFLNFVYYLAESNYLIITLYKLLFSISLFGLVNEQ